VLMPCSWPRAAAGGEGAASNWISPRRGGDARSNTLMSVDFPRAVLPIRRGSLPAEEEIDGGKARTPGKSLLRCLISRMGTSGMRAPAWRGSGVRARAFETVSTCGWR